MICYSAMYVQCTFNVRSMHVQCTFNARSLPAHCALVQLLLDSSGVFTGKSLSVAHASMHASPCEENAAPLGSREQPELPAGEALIFVHHHVAMHMETPMFGNNAAHDECAGMRTIA